MIRKYLYLLLLTIGILSLTPVPDAYAAVGSKNEGKLSISVYTGRTADLGEYIEYSPSLEKYRDWDAGYKSGNTKIATVSKTGLVKGISEGKTTITVSFKSYEWSAKKKAYVDTTVKKTINVSVVLYDGSTGRDYFYYDIENGSVTITGLAKKKADISFPKYINGFPVKKIGADSFSDNSIIKSLTFPEGIETIEEYAFSDCKSLKTVKLSNSIKSIGESAFSGCKSLVTINLPSGLETIARDTFYECSKLKEISLGKKIKVIGAGAFSECTSLKTVTFGNAVQTIERYAFMDAAL